MLYFRDYRWLLVNGYSHFQAYITPEKRKREEVTWFLDLRYEATGPAWRRVLPRPVLSLRVSSFQPPAHSWKGLERLSFWDLPGARDGRWVFPPRGLLDFTFHPREGRATEMNREVEDHLWRVAAREGRWFTVEMALLRDDDQDEKVENLPPLVTPAGEEAGEDEPRWKERAELYLIENIPFGTVTVRAPRNARDLEAYAIARAQELIGDLGEPEHIRLEDHSQWEKASDDSRRDIYVELHFHGHYER